MQSIFVNLCMHFSFFIILLQLPLQAIASPNVGENWTEPLTGMEFVWVPSGCFMMGSPENELGRNVSRESPQHQVCVDGFWMGKYEVTNRQFRMLHRRHKIKKYKGLRLDQDSQPAVQVSWNWANEYAQWLSDRTDYVFRLPTEAEWEYAARGGTSTARFWGENPDDACSYANVADLTTTEKWGWSITHDCDDGYAVSSPVGSFAPNPFGLHDMLGNVWEWVGDVFVSDAYSQPNRRNNPLVTHSGSLFYPEAFRVYRGGSWSVVSQSVRSAVRYWEAPYFRDDTLGFRLLREP